MYFGDAVHQPGLAGMAANTVVANGLAVDIGMARSTVHRGFIEYKGTMTKFAVGLGMCAFEREFGFIVVKLQGTVVDGPSSRVVALNTVHFQLVPVGGLANCGQAVQKDRYYKWQSIHLNLPNL